MLPELQMLILEYAPFWQPRIEIPLGKKYTSTCLRIHES